MTACCTRCTSRTVARRYRNRYVRTEALAAEQAAGDALWTGINERPDFSHPGGPFKDTANTDLVFHAGRLLALWWLGGPCYQVALPSLETVGQYDFNGTLTTGLTAHPKLDPETGELMVFDYNVAAAVPDVQRDVGGRPDGAPHRHRPARAAACCTTSRSPSTTRSSWTSR